MTTLLSQPPGIRETRGLDRVLDALTDVTEYQGHRYHVGPLEGWHRATVFLPGGGEVVLGAHRTHQDAVESARSFIDTRDEQDAERWDGMG